VKQQFDGKATNLDGVILYTRFGSERFAFHCNPTWGYDVGFTNA
jgi:hypothetical protein